MSSPPYHTSPPAHSPPYPSHSQLPNINTVNGGTSNRKRPIGGDAPAPALKRRNLSIMSAASAGSAHPLRQTSFPPDGESSPYANGDAARSPSVGFDDDNMSMVSGAHSAISNTQSNAPLKKKRGRKSKVEKARELAERQGTPSVVGGRAGTVGSGVSGGAGAKSTAEAEEEEDEEEEDDKDLKTKMGMAQFKDSFGQRDTEKKLRAQLATMMDKDQAERYEIWRASKLTESVVKRLVNATVSQSVPPAVYKAMQSVAKVFVGDIIEQSRKVQGEWIAKTGEQQSEPNAPFPEWPYENDVHFNDGTDGKPKDVLPKVKPQEPPRGALRPDHVREAWRRFKNSAEGGSVGGLGLWHVQQSDGVERFGTRTKGRRLFK